jgi:uncharacterized protein (TIGR02145 family)
MNPFNYRLVKQLRGLIMFALLLLTVSLLAQAPQAFKYQAVVRDLSGNPIIASNVSVRIGVVPGATENPEVYREVHNVVTSSGGLITLDIGSGIADIGTFGLISWGLGDYFVKIEVDINGGNNFVLMGTSQLLSVPYAIFAKEAGGPPSYTWAQLQDYLLNRSGATAGMMVYVSDEGQMIYYNGEQWVTTSDECFPPASLANAGEDQADIGGTSINLSAESPKFGTGVWSIISEDNGEIISISDIYDPNALLSTTGGNFVLQWTVSNECGETFDQVNISFCPPNTLAAAGPDQTGLINPSAQLSANVPEIGNSGAWSVIGGVGGSFSNINDPLATFNGTPGATYQLRWTISTGCNSNYDDVIINFCYTLTLASAGSDLSGVIGTSTILAGNEPGSGNSGNWSIISGEGGLIVDSAMFNSEFTGLPNTTYVLKWTVTSDCQESFDEVTIYFCPTLTVAAAGADQTNIDGTSAQLAGNTPGVGNTGLWTIHSSVGTLSSGDGFVDSGNPNTIFNGTAGTSYVLRWSITNLCGQISFDDVAVSFCPPLVQSIAGADAPEACIPHALAANSPGAGNTGQWSVLSGSGGSFSDINNPASTFSGAPGSTYQIVWTISNACGSSSDTLTITFGLYPAIANAGPDQLHVEGNTVTLSGNTCSTGGIGVWSIVAGEGGSFVDVYDPNTTFTGVQNGQVYELAWTISTVCYSSFDIVNVSFVPVFICGGDLVDDRDSRVYSTVQIGDKCWMAENLNVGTQAYTTPSNNGIIEKFCYANETTNCDIYGGMYSWNELMNYTTTEGSQGICPPGWHVPSKTEYESLAALLGDISIAGGKMKEVGNDHWTNNTGATNESGFTAFGGGFHNGMFIGFKTTGNFATSTPSSSNYFFVRLYSSATGMDLLTIGKSAYTSVRCVKD